MWGAVENMCLSLSSLVSGSRGAISGHNAETIILNFGPRVTIG